MLGGQGISHSEQKLLSIWSQGWAFRMGGGQWNPNFWLPPELRRALAAAPTFPITGWGIAQTQRHPTLRSPKMCLPVTQGTVFPLPQPP